MYTYITDGSFEGLLTAVFESYANKAPVLDILHGMPTQMNFATEYKVISTDEQKAIRVYTGIQNKISDEAAQNVTLCWLSEMDGCGNWILRYLRKGFVEGANVDKLITHPWVRPVHVAAFKVGRETHRLLGLCRFKLTQKGFYQSIISPDHNQLTLLAPHFADRMSNQRWSIYDEKRDIAVIFDTQRWLIVPGNVARAMPSHPDEVKCQALWQRYFNTISIGSRMNPDLQRQMMPKRYWKNLIEIPNGLYRVPK